MLYKRSDSKYKKLPDGKSGIAIKSLKLNFLKENFTQKTYLSVFFYLFLEVLQMKFRNNLIQKNLMTA